MKQTLIKNRIIKSFNFIKNEKNLHHITINPQNICHSKDLIFRTKFYIRELMRLSEYNNNPVKFLFVVEYSSFISSGTSTTINRLGEHVHLLISSPLTTQQLEGCFYTTYNGKVNSYFERIDNRTDKEQICNYLLKQEKYFNDNTFRTNVKV